MTLEEAYLDHILLHLRSNDPDCRPVRTYLDSWFAHSVGPEMMERRTPRPQWLNRGDLQRRPELARRCHAISIEADERIKRGEVSDLAKDHTVPINQLISELSSTPLTDRDQIRAYLLRRYRVAVVTRDEHKKLGYGDSQRRKSKRQFTPDDDVYARYDCPDYGIRYMILRN